MACKKIFWDNPYLTDLKAVVTHVDGDKITLDQTIFYAFSGGQQSDSGKIANHEVLEAKKEGLEIIYTLPVTNRLSVGDEVDVHINWEKRYKLMKLHFAAELVLELVTQNFNHPEKVGANITEDKARLDFIWDGNIKEIFPELMAQLSRLIESDLQIISDFENRDEERRFWKIEGFAKVPCGGTHIKSTGEIGCIQLKRNNIGGGKERIEVMLCDSK